MARQWDEARGSSCAFDRAHTFTPGARVWAVTILGDSIIRKEYCADCAVARWGAPPDTGEISDARDDFARVTGRATDGDSSTAGEWQRFDEGLVASLFDDSETGHGER